MSVVLLVLMVVIVVILAVLGLALGSFVNALTWRIHEREIELQKSPTEKRKKYLKDLSITKGRSMCPHCHHVLGAMDLVPVFSWLILRGKCRYCHHRIEDSPLVELVTAILIIGSYIFWPMPFHGSGLFEFILWIIFLVGFVALAVYDLRWYLLPNKIVYSLLGLSVVQLLAVLIFFNGGLPLIWGALWGFLIGGGIFYVLFQVSKGAWIGGGDVKLGALLGIIVGGPLNGFLLLFIASLSGSVISLPLLASGKVKRTSIVPFGPFLLFAAIIVRLFGASLVTWLERNGILP